MFNVGQFIYVYYGSKKKLFAAKVIEEVTIKKIDAVEVDYTVMLKNDKNSTFTITELKTVKGTEIFNTSDELKDFMLNKAKESIDLMVSNCIREKDNYWPPDIPKVETQQEILDKVVESQIEENTITTQNKIEIQLENGQKANIIDNSGLLSDLTTESEQVQKKNESTFAWRL